MADADELTDAEIEMDRTGLYQEETFTDRRVGTLQRLTPRNSDTHSSTVFGN